MDKNVHVNSPREKGFAQRTHGTVSCYNAGCRCHRCKGANTAKARVRRARLARADETVEERVEQAVERLNVEALAGVPFHPSGASRAGPLVGDEVRALRLPEVRCLRGPRWAHVSFTRPRVRLSASACGGIDCPVCAPGAVVKMLRPVLNDWQDADISSVQLSDREWKGSTGKAIREQYTDPDGTRHYFWLLQGYGDERIVFAPGRLAGGQPVANPGVALVEAALRVPTLTAWRAGNRYGGVRVSQPVSRLYVNADGSMERSTRRLDNEQPDRYRRAGRSVRIIDEPWTMDDTHRLVERVAGVELVRDQDSRAPYAVSATLADGHVAKQVVEATAELHAIRTTERRRRASAFEEFCRQPSSSAPED